MNKVWKDIDKSKQKLKDAINEEVDRIFENFIIDIGLGVDKKIDPAEYVEDFLYYVKPCANKLFLDTFDRMRKDREVVKNRFEFLEAMRKLKNVLDKEGL